jgi:uncharacterized protein (TIGR02271 family)
MNPRTKEANVALTETDVRQWRGQNLVASDGDKIGKIEEIYLDAETDVPEWALVTTGMFGTKQSFVPIQDASAGENGDGIRVPFDKQMVKDAPKVDPDGHLSDQEEADLYSYYGREYTRTADAAGRPDSGGDVSGPDTDDAMTRSEEELTVGTTEREAGRVRLKKYVVEEQVTQTVPVRREEVRVEREAITDANIGDATDGPAISEEEHEVVLHAEEPVVEKRAVPQERVRLEKDAHTEQREVSDTVRKERVDVDDSRRQ